MKVPKKISQKKSNSDAAHLDKTWRMLSEETVEKIRTDLRLLGTNLKKRYQKMQESYFNQVDEVYLRMAKNKHTTDSENKKV